VVFADGFAGAYKDPGRAAFRPTGLAEGPDGALYVSDDVHGRIWRITYNGDGADKVAPAPAPAVATTAPDMAAPPEGTHPDAGRSTPVLPTPPGDTVGQVALGDRILHGEASDGTCSGCHGSNAGGSTVGPPLNSGHWLWSDGSLPGLTATIENGVAHPKQYQGVMPPLGGAPLSPRDVAAVTAYVWAVGHAGKP
jgi:mono/diheme cytochrome c family protein